jgi:hypothetical protein
LFSILPSITFTQLKLGDALKPNLAVLKSGFGSGLIGCAEEMDVMAEMISAPNNKVLFICVLIIDNAKEINFTQFTVNVAGNFHSRNILLPFKKGI